MQNRFNELKKEIKNRLIISTSISIVLIIIGISIALIYKLYLLLIFIFLIAFVVFPLIFGIGKKKFELKKIQLINDSIQEENKVFDLIYTYKKEETIDDFIQLGITNLTNYFFISSDILAKYKNTTIHSYGVRFRSNDKNNIKGRFIKFTFDFDIKINKNDVSGSFLKSAEYLRKIVVNENNLLIFVATYSKNKDSKNYTLEPHEFKTYEDFKLRINKELDFYQNIIDLFVK